MYIYYIGNYFIIETHMQNRKPLIFIILILFLISCSNKRWDVVKIDSEISKNSIYKELEKQEEISPPFNESEPYAKRTSDVAYFSGEKINLKQKFPRLNKCNAHFSKSDTLVINIGLWNGYVGSGFIINFKNKKFYTEPYYSTHLPNEDKVKPVHEIIYQKLTLDKSSYKIGDSLYGNIEFKSIEKDDFGNKKEHFGKGSFRTKITR